MRASVLFQLLRKHGSRAEKRWHLRDQLFGQRARGLHVDDEVRRTAGQRRVLQIYGNAMNKRNVFYITTTTTTTKKKKINKKTITIIICNNIVHYYIVQNMIYYFCNDIVGGSTIVLDHFVV